MSFTVAEVASRAGVEPGFVDRLCELSTSRIADYARQGEVLVSDEVVAASTAMEGVSFDPIGPVELKGVTGAVSLNVARRAS